MKNLFVWISFFTLLAFVMTMQACKQQPSESTATETSGPPSWQALEKEVMDLHDEVMPKLSDINNLVLKLEEAKSETELTPELEFQVNASIERLKEADGMMWDWMHNYKRPEASDSPAEVETYLTGEKEKMNDVRDAVFSSLQIGNAILTTLTEKNE